MEIKIVPALKQFRKSAESSKYYLSKHEAITAENQCICISLDVHIEKC